MKELAFGNPLSPVAATKPVFLFLTGENARNGPLNHYTTSQRRQALYEWANEWAQISIYSSVVRELGGRGETFPLSLSARHAQAMMGGTYGGRLRLLLCAATSTFRILFFPQCSLQRRRRRRLRRKARAPCGLFGALVGRLVRGTASYAEKPTCVRRAPQRARARARHFVDVRGKFSRIKNPASLRHFQRVPRHTHGWQLPLSTTTHTLRLNISHLYRSALGRDKILHVEERNRRLQHTLEVQIQTAAYFPEAVAFCFFTAVSAPSILVDMSTLDTNRHSSKLTDFVIYYN